VYFAAELRILLVSYLSESLGIEAGPKWGGGALGAHFSLGGGPLGPL